MSLDLNALLVWVVVTFIFIVVIGVLYKKVVRSKKEVDEHRDETPAY